MDPFTIFQVAAAGYSNRNRLSQALKWFDGDDNAFLSPEKKIEKLERILKNVIETQELQDDWLQRITKALVRLWIIVAVTFLLSAIGLVISLLP